MEKTAKELAEEFGAAMLDNLRRNVTADKARRALNASQLYCKGCGHCLDCLLQERRGEAEPEEFMNGVCC